MTCAVTGPFGAPAAPNGPMSAGNMYQAPNATSGSRIEATIPTAAFCAARTGLVFRPIAFIMIGTGDCAMN
jgi:hypothetical protein